MLITVAICTWNRARLLDQTLSSLCQLVIPEGTSWELLIIDNASTDDTPDVIQQHTHLGRLPLRGLRQPNIGKSCALNTAIESGQGEYQLFTDDDVMVDPLWLQETLASFTKNKADVVYGKIEPVWESHPPKWFSADFNGNFAILDHGDSELIVNGPPFLGYGVNSSFRRSAMLQLGKFREDLGPHEKNGGGEDTDMFLRAFSAKMRVVYNPRAVIRHFIPGYRCTKSFHRRRAWFGGMANLELIRGQAENQPRLLGIPRYMYSLNLVHLRRFMHSVLAGEESRAFSYELKLIRFGSLLWHAWKQ